MYIFINWFLKTFSTALAYPPDPGPLQKPAVGEFRPFRECRPFSFPISNEKRKKVEKRISHGHQARAFYFIFYPVCCRVILAVGFNFLFVFQFFSLFSKPKIKNKSKTPLNSISVTTREERRRRRRCRELCSCCTHTNGKEWKRRRISTRKAAATSECPSVQPETSGPLEQHTEEEEEEKVMCLRHPFTRRQPDAMTTTTSFFFGSLFCCCIISQFPATYSNVMQLTKYKNLTLSNLQSLKSNGLNRKVVRQCARNMIYGSNCLSKWNQRTVGSMAKSCSIEKDSFSFRSLTSAHPHPRKKKGIKK